MWIHYLLVGNLEKKCIDRIMEVSFYKFSKILESQENTKALDLVRYGNSLRNGECGNFWDDFINLLSNAEGMSELLDIPKEKITAWAGYINAIRKEADSLDSSSDKKNKIIKNGD